MSSPSPPSTEPTSPLTEAQIDIDLLVALHQRNADSEDCSSVNASDGSSCVSQESGWERDEEFTYAHTSTTTTHSSNEEYNDGHKASGSGLNGVTKEIKLFPKLDPMSQRECKSKNGEQRDILIDSDKQLTQSCHEVSNESNSRVGSNSNPQESSNKKVAKLLIAKNWEFPVFPVDVQNTNDMKREISIICYSRQTQTERLDWALLELKQSNEDSNEGLETQSVGSEEAPVESKVDPCRNQLKVMLHKGTFTSDIPNDISADQKLLTLKQKFPKAEDSQLNEILGACLGDEKWAEKLLSELNDNHFDVRDLEQLTLSSEPSVSSPEIDSESISTEEEEPFEMISDPKSSFDEPEFVLTLDHLLAAQLQSHFGCITDSLTEDDLTITLSHGVARLLHHNWKKSLNQKPLNKSSNSAKTQSISNNNEKKNKKPKKDKHKKTLELEESVPKSELQEIMDLEMAKALSRQEYNDSMAAKAMNGFASASNAYMAEKLFSTKLKQDQLYQRYPGIDQSFLDTIFESNNYCLGKTIAVLDSSLGLNDDFSRETEVLLAEENSGSPMSGSSRSPSPSKPIRKKIDFSSVLNEMNRHLERRKEYNNKARLAYQRKMYAVASFYGDECFEISRQIDRLSAEIVDEVLTNSTNSNELDLHGLHLKEVNSILAEYLKRKSDELRRSAGKRKLVLNIITGYGATKGVQGTIKPKVILFLKQKGLPYEMVNMGVIRVTLTQ